MIVKSSKKALHRKNIELYNDNVKMRIEIENLIAVNAELVLLMDISKRERDEVNIKIEEHNRRWDKENGQQQKKK